VGWYAVGTVICFGKFTFPGLFFRRTLENGNEKEEIRLDEARPQGLPQK